MRLYFLNYNFKTILAHNELTLLIQKYLSFLIDIAFQMLAPNFLAF